MSPGGPFLYLPGTSKMSPKGGKIISEKTAKTLRISRTAAFTYQTSGGSITVGGDIASLTKKWSGYKVTTRAKTYVINIGESDLR